MLSDAESWTIYSSKNSMGLGPLLCYEFGNFRKKSLVFFHSKPFLTTENTSGKGERAYHNLKQLLMGIIIVMRRARGLNLRATQKMPIVPQKKHF